MKTNSRVFKALEKSIERGFPQQAFFNLALKNDGELFYLGSACLSAGKRIIFFPSTKENIIQSACTGIYIGKELDHLTLGGNFERWHITLSGEEHLKPNLRTRRVEGDLFYWFSFNLKSLTSLPRFSKKGNTYSITRTFSGIPPTHSKQREVLLERAMDAGQLEVLAPEVIQQQPFYQEDRYFHFSFLIDTSPQKTKKKGFINPPLECEKVGITSIHEVRIKEDVNLVISCAYLKGELNYNVLYNWLPSETH